MIEVNGKNFRLRFDIGTIEKIEERLAKGSLMALIAQAQGMLPVATTRICLAFALVDENDKHLPFSEANSYATQIIQKSYPNAVQLVIFCMQRDCPSFFQGDSLNLNI